MDENNTMIYKKGIYHGLNERLNGQRVAVFRNRESGELVVKYEGGDRVTVDETWCECFVDCQNGDIENAKGGKV